MCDKLDYAISATFGITGVRTDPYRAAVVKEADTTALLIESRELLHDGGLGLRRDRGIREDEVNLLPCLGPLLGPEDAEAEFVAAHERLRVGQVVAN